MPAVSFWPCASHNKAGSAACGTGGALGHRYVAPGMIYAFAADILFRFSKIRCQPQLSEQRAWRRLKRWSRSLCGQQGLSVHLNPDGCLLSLRCHLKHTGPPPATFHTCCSPCSPSVQNSLPCSPHPPPLPFQAGQAAPAPRSIT